MNKEAQIDLRLTLIEAEVKALKNLDWDTITNVQVTRETLKRLRVI